MANKKIGTAKQEVNRDATAGVIGTMKPFVNFGVKALAVLGTALVFIVKNIPKPEGAKPKSKDNRVVKI
jgi:hypothetical protein